MARKIRKSSEIGHLIYSEQYQNSITVKEGLVQLKEQERNRMKNIMMKHGLMI